MGADLLKKATETFEKCHRRGAEKLDEMSLFSGSVSIGISTLAHLLHTAAPTEGMSVTALARQGKIVLFDDRQPIAVIENAAPSVLETLSRAGAGVATGKVVRVYSLTRMIDVVLE